MSQALCDRSINFIQRVFKAYFEERDFKNFISAFDDDISWIGTGAQEVCKNYSEAIARVEAEESSWDGHFIILEQWCKAYTINENFCLVYGDMKIAEDQANPIALEMSSKFSVICHRLDNDELKIFHIHFSVPNSVIQNYNSSLGQKSQQHTELLKDKNFEWETITNNIEVSTVRCNLDDSLTVSYANNEFYRMIGYTKKQLKEEHNYSLASLLYSDDEVTLYKKVREKVETENAIVSVDRLIRRDGTNICILTKGSIVVGLDGKQEFYAILTDITEQQEQEETLRISEKRCEIAMQLCNATMFEYDIITKQLILPGSVAKMYKVPKIVENGVETFIKQGIIAPESADIYRELYEKIQTGVPSARAFINTKDDDGIVYEFELILTNVFDNKGKPIRAIGVRRNMTVMRQLEKEKNYGETMASNKYFVCEANITQDKVLHINEKWAEDFDGVKTKIYSCLMASACESVVEPSYRDLVSRHLSREYLQSAFERGHRLVSFIYRKKAGNSDYRWFEATLNIIRDGVTNDINLRYYTTDINAQKEKEQKALNEQKRYENMIAKSVIAYEVNITRDIFISGNEHWDTQFGIGKSDCYSNLMRDLCEKAIHPNDKNKFLELYLRENVLDAFRQGKREIVCEYRRPDENGEFIWVRCSLHIYEELSTGDVKGYAYVEDINNQKKEQLGLIYRSEHDLLTGLYNKITTEKLIGDFLNTSKGKSAKHAYIIIDIDHFKEINDNFGHAFGDAVLSQISAKIKELFREDDVVGRIGGDEFVVLMKNISSSKIAIAKAGEICGVLAEAYTQNGQEHKISASIGIAIYNKHGKSYDELYRHSDSALYISKRNGRDRFYLYNDNMEIVMSEVKDIDTNALLEVKTFEQNISEYVFRILYESQDSNAAINVILSLIGKHYNVSRVYIFEDSANGLGTSNTFEWCNTGVESKKDKLQNLTYSNASNHKANFNASGVCYISDVSKLSDETRELFQTHDTKSMVQYSIIKKGEFAGFIGFDECRYPRVPSKRELIELNSIASLLGMFIMEMRALKQSESMQEMAMSILDGLDSCAYICDPENYQILFINNNMKEELPTAEVSGKCYEALWNREGPCKDCPLENLKANDEKSSSAYLYNSSSKAFIKTTASWINWLNDSKLCLVLFHMQS